VDEASTRTGQTWIGRRRAYATRWRNVLKIKELEWEHLNALLEGQDNECAICGCEIEFANGHGGRNAHLDHCHDRNVIRGWLCNNCNSGLGNFKDRPDLIRKALTYLAERGEGVPLPDIELQDKAVRRARRRNAVDPANRVVPGSSAA
jgi:hypothetical protein